MVDSFLRGARRAFTPLGASVGFAFAFVVALIGQAQAQQGGTIAADLPPNADPNACYARVFVPATTRQVPQEVVTREGHRTIEIREPTYRTETRTIVLREGYTRVEWTAPVFETQRRTIEIEPERFEYEVVAPEFATEPVAVQIRRAYQTLDPSNTTVERIAGATGEVISLRVVPDLFRAVDREVVSREAFVRTERIPPRTREIEVQVMATPPQEVRIEVPPEVTTVEVQVEATAYQEIPVEVPPTTTNVPVEELDQQARIVWRETLCRDRADRTLIISVQRALARRGFNPGPIDGVLGGRTAAALRAFQERNGLSTGGLLIETLDALGVQHGG